MQRLLRLVEQPRVLDRDQRLIDERLGQRNFLRAECARPGARQRQQADALALTQQWQEERGIHTERRTDDALVLGQLDG